ILRPAALLALALALAGCSSLIPNPLQTTSGDNRPLLPEARAFRCTVPQPAPVPRELAKGVIPAYIVEPGDGLQVTPPVTDLPGDLTVLPDGRVDLGRYGRLSVAGRSVEEI